MTDNWSDDESPATNGGFGGMSNGFNFGRGRGLAKGSGFGGNDDQEPRSFGKPGGLGGGGGFGNKSGGFGGRGDDNSGGFGNQNGGGFGSGGGGFGSRGGFGSGDEPRGGGFGEKRGFGRGRGSSFGSFQAKSTSGGGNTCFKCNEEGHFARECPNADSSGGGGRGGFGGGGGGACFKCNEEGHRARDCPNADSSGGGGSRGGGCYKCGGDGHIARDCPDAGGSGGGSKGKGCFKCGEEGHFSRECPNGGGDQGGRPRGGFGGFGSSGGDGGDSKGKGCFKCGEEGHFSRECPNADADGEKKTEIYVPPAPPESEEELFQSIAAGINFNKYESIPVEVSGDNGPERGISSFDEADLSETVRSNVRKAHYEKPTPIQKWAIPIILSGRDLMGCAQTGSGKTAAFLLPILTGIIKNNLIEGGSGFGGPQYPAAVIVGPTRELVTQIHVEAKKFSHSTCVRPVVVYGGTSVGHQAQQLERGAHVVVGTPGRLLDFIGKGKINLTKVKYLILDEADRMLDMGFEPEIQKLVTQFELPEKGQRQTLMFSATFPKEIQDLAQQFLNNYIFVTVGRVGGANSDITQEVLQVTKYEKRDKLLEILNTSGTDRTLVFLETKRSADFLAALLSQKEFPATSIHGDRLQREREEALLDFKTGRAPILIATSVAARGLDIPGVKHVVNYDMPSGIDEYVHRIGRTGRCGNLGRATSFFDPEESKDKDLARSLVKTLADALQEVPSWLEEIAEGAIAVGFQGGAGKFGGRDTRRGKFDRTSDNAGFGNSDGFSGNGFGGGGGGGGANDADEDWD